MQIYLAPQKKSADPSLPVLIISPRALSVANASRFAGVVGESFTTYLTLGELPDAQEVVSCAERVAAELKEQRIKRLTVLGVGAGCGLAQALCMSAEKSVRKLVLIDPTTRLNPSFGQRCLDYVERFLPLGLPLRSLSRNFDSRPFLHRLRCPVLIVLSSEANAFVREQSTLIARRIPTAWIASDCKKCFEESSLGSDLAEMLAEFMSVPAKRPQKNLRSEEAA